jgi:DNA sulfur modification protein DndB
LSTTVACLRSKMGITEYYVATMKVGELIRSVGFAEKLPEWDDMDIEERMQRKLDEQRVAKEIVPYLQNDPNRFFGSLIVDIYGGWNSLVFEPLAEVSKLPKAYEQAMKMSAELGFLHLAGNERLIALDGQHRLLALKKAVEGDEKLEIEPDRTLLNDDITVIFIPHGPDSRKIRSIFNKVNRYAKSTSRGDNIVTSEDDPFAILARRLMKPGEPLPEELVNWTSNTLSPTSLKFTTISAIYDSVQTILEDERLSQKVRPSEGKLDSYYKRVKEVWEAVLQGIDSYVNMLDNRDLIPKERKTSLLFKPMGQMVMLEGLIRAMKEADLPLELGIQRLNALDWSLDADHWKDVLVNASGSIITRTEARRLAARLVAWMIAGTNLDKRFITELQEDFSKYKGHKDELISLPLPVSDVPAPFNG